MGGAASITVLPPDGDATSALRNMLRDKKRLNRLYKHICNYGHEKGDGRIYLKGSISLPELILYMSTEDRDPILKEFSQDPEVIKVAFRHCDRDVPATKKKASKDSKNDMLSKREFRKLLPTLYLFTHLFKVFEVGDCSIHDRKIFPKEFLTGKSYINSIKEVVIHDITDEQWSNEFPTIDKNKNGYITFDEFCAYVVKTIVNPQFFIHVSDDNGEDSDSENDGTPRTAPVEGGIVAADTTASVSAEASESAALGIAEMSNVDANAVTVEPAIPVAVAEAVTKNATPTETESVAVTPIAATGEPPVSTAIEGAADVPPPTETAAEPVEVPVVASS